MVWDLLVYLIIGGVLGARLWHILTPPPSSIAQGFTTQFYLTHPLDALSIWKGGLGIPGTIIGGLLALYLYARKHRTFTFLEWTDIAAPSLALGQAIGRWGNFANQEIYGAATNLPWKIYIDPAHRLSGFEAESYYHPLFAYESLLNLANMFLLLWIMRGHGRSLKRGDVFNVYLIFYPLVRFGLDFLRLDASEVAGLNVNQAVMVVVALGAGAVLLWRHRTRAMANEQMPTVAKPSLDAGTAAPLGQRAKAPPKRRSIRSATKKTSSRRAPARKGTRKS
jgi:phosphatidylglycerol:prolipoprotein diacylglycerol transferase